MPSTWGLLRKNAHFLKKSEAGAQSFSFPQKVDKTNHDSMTKLLRRRVLQSKCVRRPSFRPRRGRNMAAQKHHTNERLLKLKQEFWAAACLSEASSAAQLKNARGF